MQHIQKILPGLGNESHLLDIRVEKIFNLLPALSINTSETQPENAMKVEGNKIFYLNSSSTLMYASLIYINKKLLLLTDEIHNCPSTLRLSVYIT